MEQTRKELTPEQSAIDQAKKALYREYEIYMQKQWEEANAFFKHGVNPSAYECAIKPAFDFFFKIIESQDQAIADEEQTNRNLSLHAQDLRAELSSLKEQLKGYEWVSGGDQNELECWKTIYLNFSDGEGWLSFANRMNAHFTIKSKHEK